MYTVVVADDEEELRRALIRKVDFESLGFSVIGEAENGAEALELVEKLEPDLLLTDIRMPFISGIELARQVREIRPAMQIAFISGYDDFSYAQQAIQYNIVSYMLKPITSAGLTEELKRIKSKIDDKFSEFASQNSEQVEGSSFLMSLILDGYQERNKESKNEQIMKEAVSYGLLKEENSELHYTVVVTSILDLEDNNCTTRASVNAIDSILRKYIKHVSFYTEGKVVSLLMATLSDFDKYLHIAVEEIAQNVKRIMKLSCSIGISRPVKQIIGAHEAYIEAMNAIGYSRRSGTSVYFISDVERTEDFDLEKIQDSISEVENLIRGGTKQELENYLNAFFDTMDKRCISQVVANFMMTQLISEVFRIVYAVAEDDAVTELEKHISFLNQMFMADSSQIRKRYIDFCLSARDLIAEQRKKSSKVICEKALELIERKYMDTDLSLVSISNEIAVSPNYLSALIKKYTDSTFIELLTKKRIEIAKDLILCSSMKIREISEKCGYSDQHYFSYCFKKYTGESPIMCRRNNEET